LGKQAVLKRHSLRICKTTVIGIIVRIGAASGASGLGISQSATIRSEPHHEAG
jgi:hypothetical protein